MNDSTEFMFEVFTIIRKKLLNLDASPFLEDDKLNMGVEGLYQSF